MRTIDQVRAMVEELRASKGDGYAPPADEALDAAREGRLWAVYTLNAGEDSIVIADSASSALADVAVGLDPEMPVPARWSADRIELDPAEIGDICAEAARYYCIHQSPECAQCASDRQWRERDEWQRQRDARDRYDEQNQARRADDYCRAAGICGH